MRSFNINNNLRRNVLKKGKLEAGRGKLLKPERIDEAYFY